METPLLIGVLGASRADPELYRIARSLGSELARRGWWLVCGGLGGVMEAACRGSREADGRTIGILPGRGREEANAWVEVPIVTGIADARNAIITRTAHACVAIGGAYGTLTEIAFCLKFGTPVVALASDHATFPPLPEVAQVDSPVAACDWIAGQL